MAKFKSKKSEALIYCGPNLPNGELNRYAIYRNGVPKHISKHVEKCAAISHLFIPVSKLNEVKQKMQSPGNKENTWYTQVVQYVQGSES